jgi:hypothetical protein
MYSSHLATLYTDPHAALARCGMEIDKVGKCHFE